MQTECHDQQRHRPWKEALLGSSAVSIAIAVVIATSVNAVQATITIIAVLIIFVLALWEVRRRR